MKEKNVTIYEQVLEDGNVNPKKEKTSLLDKVLIDKFYINSIWMQKF